MKEKDNQKELEKGLIKLSEKEDLKLLETLIQKYKPVDFAETLNDLNDKDKVLAILNVCQLELKTEIFIHLNFELQEYFINNIADNDLKLLIDEIYSDDLVDLIDEMPEKVVQRILNVTTIQKRQELNNILKNEEESVGGNMSVDFIKFNKKTTVAQARKIIYTTHHEFEKVDDLFIVDEFGVLLGEISLKDLVINEPHKRMSSIMESNVISVKVDADQEEIIQLFKKYDLSTLPVVDDENKIIGIITSDDALDVIEQEQTEDMQRLVGIQPLNDDLFKISAWKIFTSRAVWLVLGLLLATISQILIIVFLNVYGVNSFINEPTSKAFAAIYLLVPMALVIANISGITANQSTTSFVRILSLNRYDNKEIFKMILKEFLASLYSILLILAFNIVRLVIFYQAQFNEVQSSTIWYSILASSIAIIIGMILATFMGTFLPLLLKKMKLDPAIISSPLITSIIDILTIGTFFGIGLLFF